MAIYRAITSARCRATSLRRRDRVAASVRALRKRNTRVAGVVATVGLCLGGNAQARHDRTSGAFRQQAAPLRRLGQQPGGSEAAAPAAGAPPGLPGGDHMSVGQGSIRTLSGPTYGVYPDRMHAYELAPKAEYKEKS